MSISFIPIAKPDTGAEELEAVGRPLASGWLTQGPETAAFEREFATLHQVRHAIAVSNCTVGLHLMLAALGLGPGDEVLVPSFTWVATANAVEYLGARPVLTDVDPATFLMDMQDAARKVTARTKAVIPVHLFGLCADMAALERACPGIPVLGDAACAVAGASPSGMAGGLGLAAAFSFHPRKMVTTGEGGMVTTNDNALAERMRLLRNHGAAVSEEERHHGPQPWLLPAFEVLGYNYRLTDIQSAVGRAQLAKLPRFLAERRELAARYREGLSRLSWLALPVEPEGYTHGWQAYVCTVDEARAPRPRNELMRRLHERGIATRPGTHAVHLLGLYRKKYGIAPGDFPGALAADATSLALPFFNGMTREMQDTVIAALAAM